MMASLLVGTLSGSASHLALAYLAAHGDHGGNEFWTFAFAVSLDSFAYAFASIVLITPTCLRWRQPNWRPANTRS